MMMTSNTKIQEQALLVHVKIRKWSNSKTDAGLTDAVESDNHVAPGLIRVRKTLLDTPTVKELSKLGGKVRNNIVGKLTVPWSETGTRLLPVELIDRFEAELSDAKARWDELKAELGSVYNDAIKQAQAGLGDAFDEADYPNAQEILDRYSIEVEYLPLPTGGDLRVSLPQAKLDKLRHEVEASVKSSLEKGTKQVHERVAHTLEHLVEKLDTFGVDKKSGKVVGAFRDSTVENLNELAEVLPLLNITGDPALTKTSNDLLTQLRDLDPQQLRDDKGHRSAVADKARKIVSDLTGFYS